MEPLAKRIKSETSNEPAASKDTGGCTNGSSEDKTAADNAEKRPLLPCSSEVGAPHVPGHAPVAIEADAAEDKGSRHTMEDAWVVLPDASLGQPGKLRCAHFAIYDGHGGRQAADFARAHLHANVVSAGLPRELLSVKEAKKAIISGFKHTDEALLRESIAGGWQDGATAVCVWILGSMVKLAIHKGLFCFLCGLRPHVLHIVYGLFMESVLFQVFIANVGDAKAVLARVANTAEKGDQKSGSGPNAQGPPLKGVTITREHKAIFPLERARIEKAGGYVGENGRLLGRLEVSRAFGDRLFKKVGVSALPDVNSFEITERERFIILGCDGLWGVFGPSDAVEFVDTQLRGGASVGVACRRLIREAIRERKCKDNCTAVLIVFKHA